MRKHPPRKLDEARVPDGHYASPPGEMWGAFKLDGLAIISSGHDVDHGWEHVSVSRSGRTPTWEDMCRIKDLFWHEDELVVQYHPVQKDYVNFHPHCLHLWKQIGAEMPAPPMLLVGPK